MRHESGTAMEKTLKNIAKREAVFNAYFRGLLKRSWPFAFIFVLIAIAVVITEGYYIPTLGTTHPWVLLVAQLVVRIGDEILAAIAALLLVTLAWERWNHELIEETLKSGVLATLSDDSIEVQQALRAISADRRKCIISATYRSLVGEVARDLFAASVEPYLDNVAERYNFQSSLTLREMRLKAEQIESLKRNGLYDETEWAYDPNGRRALSKIHDELEQTVYYEKPSLFSRSDGTSVCFAFDILTFKRLLRDDDIFWREIIHLEYPLVEVLSDAKSAHAAALSFVTDILRFRAVAFVGEVRNEKKIDGKVHIEFSESGNPFIRIKFSLLPSGTKGIRIHCALPQRKTKRWCHVVFVNPTFVKSINFTYNRELFSVEDVLFLNNKALNDGGVSRADESISIKPEGCIMPVSGVAFIWVPTADSSGLNPSAIGAPLGGTR
jgi:hypothetical protein